LFIPVLSIIEKGETRNMTQDANDKNHEQPKPQWVGYQLRIKGLLNDDYLAWIGWSGERDATIGETILLIPTTDQSALYGTLNRLSDLGLVLVSITPIKEN
jgi:hypothetical protein